LHADQELAELQNGAAAAAAAMMPGSMLRTATYPKQVRAVCV